MTHMHRAMNVHGYVYRSMAIIFGALLVLLPPQIGMDLAQLAVIYTA